MVLWLAQWFIRQLNKNSSMNFMIDINPFDLLNCALKMRANVLVLQEIFSIFNTIITADQICNSLSSEIEYTTQIEILDYSDKRQLLFTPLGLACIHGPVENVQFLLQKIPTNYQCDATSLIFVGANYPTFRK